jgi:hypothetical protein
MRELRDFEKVELPRERLALFLLLDSQAKLKTFAATSDSD